MANRKITLKRNNSGEIEPLFPTTTTDQLYTSNGLVNVFDNDKLKYAYLPDGVKYGIKFFGTQALSSTALSVDSLSAFSSLSEDVIGRYVIVSSAGKLSGKFTAASGLVGSFTWKVYGEEGQFEASPADSTSDVIDVEKGDWIIFTKIETSGEPVDTVYSFSVINNTYGEATTSAPGIMSASDKTKLDGIASSADNYNGFNVTDGSNTTTIGSGDSLTFTGAGATSITESSGTITISSTNTVYTHPTHNGSSAAGTETTLSDITLVDSLSLTNGHIDSFTHRKLVAGSNVTITPASDGNITIASTDTNTVYTHPSYTTRSINTSGVDVLDTFTSDSIGSVTAITTRTLPDATTSASGVMSSTDKTKLDATNVVQYAAALDTVATYGFIYFDED